MAERAEDIFHRLTGWYFKRWPRPLPTQGRLQRCHIIAHRGAHNVDDRLENTLAAFDAAAEAGVWGIELDVRWTKDAVPVVFHDASTGRLFGEARSIHRMTAADLRRRFPLIPSLAEVVTRYGTNQHLMIEIKSVDQPDPRRQRTSLMQTLVGLAAGRDFHLMSLEPLLFDCFHDLSPAALIPIAQARVSPVSRMAINNGWAGLAGHLLPITRGTIARHHRLGQRIGTGFVDSPRALFREVSRGVDWLFTNRPEAIQRLCGSN